MVAAVAESVSIACARTVVDGDQDLFLGERGLSYLSSNPQNLRLTRTFPILQREKKFIVVELCLFSGEADHRQIERLERKECHDCCGQFQARRLRWRNYDIREVTYGRSRLE